MTNHIPLKELEMYQLAYMASSLGWEILKEIPKSFQFSIGNQFIRSVDSIGANIAEGYGRYHYKDSNRFYYNARGSLLETIHWIDLLKERELLEENVYEELKTTLDRCHYLINRYVSRMRVKS